MKAFDLEQEPAAMRDAYGSSQFGMGCLLARRLVETGVPFVEVVLNGWDTHVDNFPASRNWPARSTSRWPSCSPT